MPQAAAVIVGDLVLKAGFGGLAATAAYGATYVAVSAAITYGISAVSNELFGPGIPSFDEDLSARLTMSMTSNPPRRTVYGKTRVSGPMSFAQADQRVINGDKNAMLHYEVVLAGHQIEGFDDVWIGDEVATLAQIENEAWPDSDSALSDSNSVPRYQPQGTSYFDMVMLKLYDGTQTKADADAVANTNIGDADGRKSTDVGRGIAYIYAAARHDGEVFQNGIPKISATIRGKNDIYDPRTDSYGYTDNAVLCCADWMITPRSEGGGGWEYADLDESSIIAAANDCDDDIDITSTETQKRYRVGGSFLSTTGRYEIMKMFTDAFAGSVEKVNGKWYFKAGKYTTPAITLSEGNCIEPLSMVFKTSLRESANAIRPILAGDFSDYQESDLDTITGEFKQDITANLATDSFNQPAEPMLDGYLVRFDMWNSGWYPGQLASEIAEQTFYYVVNSDASTFQISDEAGGSPIAFGAFGYGTLVCFWDKYLTEDQGKRRTVDRKHMLTNDPEQARRLDFIELKRMRSEVVVTGRYDHSAFNLLVGEIVNVVDRERGFWAKTGSPTTIAADLSGFDNSVTGFSNGDLVVFTALGSASQGIETDTPYFVVDANAIDFNVAKHAGGTALHTVASEPDTGYEVYSAIPKIFEVIRWAYGMRNGVLGVDLVLRSANDDDWDWDDGYVTLTEDHEGVTTRNPRDIDPPTDLTALSGTDQLLLQDDGTIVTRVLLEWTPISDSQITDAGVYEIQYKLSGAAGDEWLSLPAVDGSVSSAYVANLQDGEEYDFRVRGRTAIGYFSDYVTLIAHEVVGKTAPPADPSIDSLTFIQSDVDVKVVFSPGDATEVDLKMFELQRKKSTDSWGAAADNTIALIPVKGGATSYGYIDRKLYPTSDRGTTYHYRVRAQDTTWNLSNWSAVVSVKVLPLPAPTITVTGSATGPAIEITWSDGATYPDDYFVAGWWPNVTDGIDDLKSVNGKYVDGKVRLPIDPKDPQIGVTDGYWARLARIRGPADAPANGIYANEQVTVPEDNTNPDPPTGFSYAFEARGGNLTWTKPKTVDFSHVEIQSKLTASGTYGKIGESYSATFFDNTLPPNVSSISSGFGDTYYQIRSVDHSGNVSAWVSNDDDAGKRTAPTPAWADIGLNLSHTIPGAGEVYFTWSFDETFTSDYKRLVFILKDASGPRYSTEASPNNGVGESPLLQTPSTGTETWTLKMYCEDVYGNWSAAETETELVTY